MKRIFLSAAVGLLVAACGDDTDADMAGADTAVEGPVVSQSEAPRNEAIDTTPVDAGATQTPGANSFTEGQARGAIEAAGYTDVGALTQTPEGLWQGEAMRDGAAVTVSVDYRGEVAEAGAGEPAAGAPGAPAGQ